MQLAKDKCVFCGKNTSRTIGSATHYEHICKECDSYHGITG